MSSEVIDNGRKVIMNIYGEKIGTAVIQDAIDKETDPVRKARLAKLLVSPGATIQPSATVPPGEPVPAPEFNHIPPCGRSFRGNTCTGFF